MTLYFDLTDFIRYCESNDQVTGIQRVELSLISSLVQKHGPLKIRAIANIGHRAKDWVELDSSRLINDGGPFNAINILIDTGVIKDSWHPPRHEIKRFLSKYNERKYIRALKKIQIYCLSLISKQRVRQMGLRFHEDIAAFSTAQTEAIQTLPANAAYIRITPNVKDTEIERFAAHAFTQGAQVVQMIHDLIPILHPDYHEQKMATRFGSWLKRSFTHTSQYICVSNNTRHDLEKFMEAEKVSVPTATVTLAHEFIGHPRNSMTPLKNGPKIISARLEAARFILCVGSIEIRKNGVFLLRAWEKLCREEVGLDIKLVFAGKRGWKVNEFYEMISNSQLLQKSVTLIDTPSDEELAWLYQNSLFSVYPSKYEGWGLPVGESAWFGKYCIASQTSSIPEVCGELHDYVDPSDSAAFTASIAKAIHQPEFVIKRENSIRTAKLRTWSDVADDLYAVLTKN